MAHKSSCFDFTLRQTPVSQESDSATALDMPHQHIHQGPFQLQHWNVEKNQCSAYPARRDRATVWVFPPRDVRDKEYVDESVSVETVCNNSNNFERYDLWDYACGRLQLNNKYV
mmetsp:Transcript_21704/g.24223  ORF Transcript_21704/g.24223 Transcript_21704/m.24223 type:complete len:114 (+) Transcript_21704:136-477(+)